MTSEQSAADYVSRVLSSAPALTSEQRERITEPLRNGGGVTA
jgi:hypothetical protein